MNTENKPLDLEEAVERIRKRICRITDAETCPLVEAAGRILAEDIISPIDQPPFPRSPYDGYAIRSIDSKGADHDQPVLLTVIGEVDAGGWFDGPLTEGQAVRIMTGAPIPEGADAVIRQEDTDYGEEMVRIYKAMRDHQNYIYPGEDYRKDTVLLEKGSFIGPVESGIIASAGFSELKVLRRVSAVVMSTGDELMYPGETLGPGKIYDSNMYTIAAQLRAWGVEVKEMIHLNDDAECAAEEIGIWAEKADMIVTSGGVSVGKKDIMHGVFSMLGVDRIFWRVGMKPGAAVLAGRYGKTLIFALSGNPYASYVDLHMIVRPALSEFTGNNRLEMLRGKAVLMDDYDKKSPVRRFIRAVVQDGKAYIEGHTGGNGDISSGRNINAMLDVPAGSAKIPAGSEVQVILI